MTWIWLCSVDLLFAAELNKVIEDATTACGERARQVATAHKRGEPRSPQRVYARSNEPDSKWTTVSSE